MAEYGDDATGTVCDDVGTCLYGVIARCGPFYALDDGTAGAIVDARSGEVFTHDRFHGDEEGSLPLNLVLPLDRTAIEASTP